MRSRRGEPVPRTVVWPLARRRIATTVDRLGGGVRTPSTSTWGRRRASHGSRPRGLRRGHRTSAAEPATPRRRAGRSPSRVRPPSGTLAPPRRHAHRRSPGGATHRPIPSEEQTARAEPRCEGSGAQVPAPRLAPSRTCGPGAERSVDLRGSHNPVCTPVSDALPGRPRQATSTRSATGAPTTGPGTNDREAPTLRCRATGTCCPGRRSTHGSDATWLSPAPAHAATATFTASGPENGTSAHGADRSDAWAPSRGADGPHRAMFHVERPTRAGPALAPRPADPTAGRALAARERSRRVLPASAIRRAGAGPGRRPSGGSGLRVRPRGAAAGGRAAGRAARAPGRRRRRPASGPRRGRAVR